MASVITSQSMPSGVRRSIRVAVPATETSPWIVVNATATVVAAPSTSMKVQASCSPLDIVLSDNLNGTNNAIAFDWTSSTVTVTTAEQVSNVTAIRFVAVAGAGVGEVST